MSKTAIRDFGRHFLYDTKEEFLESATKDRSFNNEDRMTEITIDEHMSALKLIVDNIDKFLMVTDYTCFSKEILTSREFYLKMTHPLQITDLRLALGTLDFLTEEDKCHLIKTNPEIITVLPFEDIEDLHHTLVTFFFNKYQIYSRTEFIGIFSVVDREFCKLMENEGPEIPLVPLYSKYTEDNFVKEKEFTYYAAKAYLDKRS